MKSILNLLLNRHIKKATPRPMIVPAPGSANSIIQSKSTILRLSILAILLLTGAIILELTLTPNAMRASETSSDEELTGLRFLEQKNFEAAVKFYRERASQNPQLVSAKVNLAYALKHSKQIKEAESIYLSLSERFPNQAVIFNNLGVLYSQSGRLDEAEQAFLKALYVNQKYSDAYLNLGFNFEKKNRFSEAILQYQKALENPELKAQQVKFLVERMRQIHAVAQSQKNSGEKL